MAAKNNCIKRDVCIFSKESFCKSNSECGHYIMEKGFTTTNIVYTKCADEVLKAINYSSDSNHGRKIIEIIKRHFA